MIVWTRIGLSTDYPVKMKDDLVDVIDMETVEGDSKTAITFHNETKPVSKIPLSQAVIEVGYFYEQYKV